MSADVNVVNSALPDGWKPQDLTTSTAYVFLEAPTAAGMVNAQQVITQPSCTPQGPPALLTKSLGEARGEHE
jgi:hypothetical protein